MIVSEIKLGAKRTVCPGLRVRLHLINQIYLQSGAFDLKIRIVLTLVLLFHCTVSHAEKLRFVAEDLPPFHYLDDSNQPSGALVEVVQALSKTLPMKTSIELMPFARTLQLVRHTPNVFMFSLLKTPSREAKYQWAGQTYKIEAFLVGLKNSDHLKINSLEDAKEYRVGTIRGYHSDHFLQQAGFTTDTNLMLSVNYQRMWRLLFKRRIDFVLTNNIALGREIGSIGLDSDEVKQYLAAEDFPNQLHIATNLTTDEKTVTLLGEALKSLKRSGRYQQIIDKWGL